MALLEMYSCDQCGAHMQAAQRNVVTVRYEGPDATGDYDRDLCGACTVVPDGVTLRALRGPGKVSSPA